MSKQKWWITGIIIAVAAAAIGIAVHVRMASNVKWVLEQEDALTQKVSSVNDINDYDVKKMMSIISCMEENQKSRILPSDFDAVYSAYIVNLKVFLKSIVLCQDALCEETAELLRESVEAVKDSNQKLDKIAKKYGVEWEGGD